MIQIGLVFMMLGMAVLTVGIIRENRAVNAAIAQQNHTIMWGRMWVDPEGRTMRSESPVKLDANDPGPPAEILRKANEASDGK